MEMVSLESEYKRMIAEIKELRELLGEVWKQVHCPDWHDGSCDIFFAYSGEGEPSCSCKRPERMRRYEDLQSRVNQKLEAE